jgi:hypothetical protein
MTTVKTTYDDPALAGEAIARDRGRELLGRVDIFNVFLLLLGCSAAGGISDLGGPGVHHPSRPQRPLGA